MKKWNWIWRASWSAMGLPSGSTTRIWHIWICLTITQCTLLRCEMSLWVKIASSILDGFLILHKTQLVMSSRKTSRNLLSMLISMTYIANATFLLKESNKSTLLLLMESLKSTELIWRLMTTLPGDSLVLTSLIRRKRRRYWRRLPLVPMTRAWLISWMIRRWEQPWTFRVLHLVGRVAVELWIILMQLMDLTGSTQSLRTQDSRSCSSQEIQMEQWLHLGRWIGFVIWDGPPFRSGHPGRWMVK